MDDVIPWWRQNFIDEFSALAPDVVVDNSEDVNFVGGTEADRRLTRERVQVRHLPASFVFFLIVMFTHAAAECILEDFVAAQVTIFGLPMWHHIFGCLALTIACFAG
jgi:hypothetical protein